MKVWICSLESGKELVNLPWRAELYVNIITNNLVDYNFKQASA